MSLNSDATFQLKLREETGVHAPTIVIVKESKREASVKMGFTSVRSIIGVLPLAVALLAAITGAHAQQGAAIQISVKGHHFQPAELHAPANQPLAITVKNLDTTPMEFESVSLRVEKVVSPGAEGVVHVRPLAPGRYEFFDDFHQETRGILVVQ